MLLDWFSSKSIGQWICQCRCMPNNINNGSEVNIAFTHEFVRCMSKKPRAHCIQKSWSETRWLRPQSTCKLIKVVITRQIAMDRNETNNKREKFKHDNLQYFGRSDREPKQALSDVWHTIARTQQVQPKYFRRGDATCLRGQLINCASKSGPQHGCNVRLLPPSWHIQFLK